MFYKLASLTLTPGKNANSTSDVFIAQPDSIKESLAGKLFILVEIESRKIENLKIINFLIDNINHNYYQSDKIPLREKLTTLKVEHIFETALAKTNKNFSDFIQNEKIKLSLNSLNITVGVIYEDMIHFVNNGHNKAFLIYKGKEEALGKKAKEEAKVEYKITDIIKQAESGQKKNDTKLFSNVISGKIPNKGHFVFTNEALPEYVSNKQLIQIISALPPVSAVEQIKSTLAKINSYVSFLGIIIKSTTIQPEEAKQPAYRGSQDSISSLRNTEDKTEGLLTPSGVVSPKKWLKMPSLPTRKPSNQVEPPQDRTFMIKDKIVVKERASRIFNLKKIAQGIAGVTKYLYNFTLYIFKPKEKSAGTETSSQSIFRSFKNRFSEISLAGSLNRKNKILLSLSLIFIILFSINVVLIKNNKKEQAEKEKYENTIAEITTRIDKAEASLLYGNESSAKEIFTEIKELLAAFPQNTDEQIAKYNELERKFVLQNEKIRHVVRLEKLEEIANFSKISNDAKAENISLVAESKKIYTADPSQKSIYILDTKDNGVTTLAEMEKEITALAFPSLSKENVLYYFNNTNIITLNTNDETIAEYAINLTGESSAYKGADTYNDRLYLLNVADNEIYRHTRSGQSFGSAQTWTTEDIDFSNSVDMAIDGHIYVLKKNGEVIKMLKGQRQELVMETVDPPITEATQLQISQDLKYIYILEPTNQRLLIFDKTGKFISQYTSDQFTGLKSFVVDETNKLLYFLNNNSVLKAEASYLTE